MTIKSNMQNETETEWKTYVPPNMRKRRNKVKNLQQVNTNNLEDFPDLSSKQPATSRETTLDFGALIREDVNPITDDVEPGFVKVYRDSHTGKSIIDGNSQDKKRHYEEVVDVIQPSGLSISQEQQLENLVARWQTYRDSMDDKYGEQSPYYGMKRLTDPLSDDDYESDVESEHSYDNHYDSNSEIDDY